LHGRSRGTEDIDIIIEKLGKDAFLKMHNDLLLAGFECIHSEYPELIYDDYLKDKTSVRYLRKGLLIPDMELKLAKDELDDYQIKTRKKLLRSEKDMEDAKHLRIIYSDTLDKGDRKNKSGHPQAAPIMRDKPPTEHIERWAEFVRTHPRSVWIKEVKPLIDSR
jgi:hypothetical protein